MDALSTVAQTIELSVAPVFLLAGIGAILNVISQRLARAIDRSRALEAAMSSKEDPAHEKAELVILDQRMRFSQGAINWSCTAALLVCLVVATLFIAALTGISAAWFVAILFIGAMAALIGSLGFLLAEVSVATRWMRGEGMRGEGLHGAGRTQTPQH